MRWFENPTKVKVMPLGLGTHPRFQVRNKDRKGEMSKLANEVYFEELDIKKVGKSMFFIKSKGKL